MTHRAALRALPLAALPFSASCATMTQAELEECAAAGQAIVEMQQYSFERMEALGIQPAVPVGQDYNVEIARSARDLLLSRKGMFEEPCPEDCPTHFRVWYFGYTNAKIENRILPKVDQLKNLNSSELREILSDCDGGLPQ